MCIRDRDLLALYNALNEGVITLLETFFELSHSNASRTLDLYKRFVDLTEHVVKYLKAGKSVGMKIPVIKHITTKLIRSLEEHLLEDERTHNTFSQSSSVLDGKSNTKASTNLSVNTGNSAAQTRLEQIREQKRILQQQLQTEQVVVSPTSPQDAVYNPFTTNIIDSITMNQTQVGAQNVTQPQQMVVQATSNPFINANAQSVPNQAYGTTMAPPPMQQNPQIQQQQPITPASMAWDSQFQPPQPQPQNLGHFPTGTSNLQQFATTPAFPSNQTGQPPQQQQPSYGTNYTGNNNAHPLMNNTNENVAPQPTGSNNPFSLNNITKESQQREQINPFSVSNFASTEKEMVHPQMPQVQQQQQQQLSLIHIFK